MKTVELLPIDQSGAVSVSMAEFPEVLHQNCQGTAMFYKAVGFEPPWIGYLALSEGRPVGIGAFKGPPQNNRAEIAYFTLPELEGRGFASATARELIRLAREAAPKVDIAAQTLPEPNASNAILRKLGFTFRGAVMHPEDGEVWEWQLDTRQYGPAESIAPPAPAEPRS